MQKLGQHFLKNTEVLHAIVDAAEIEHGDVVIEIGPGHGELTEHLLRKTLSETATLIAIEKDKELFDSLTKNPNFKDVAFKEGDVLKILPRLLEEHAKKRLHLVGNIPYYLTGFLFRILSESPHKPARVVFLIQKEVAERIVAKPPAMNRLAAITAFWGKPRYLLTVSKKDFAPPPKVDSAVIVVEKKERTDQVEESLYYSLVKMLFAQPRKTILNNMSAALGRPKEEIRTLLSRAGIREEDRPQNLRREDIAHLARVMQK